MGNIAIIEHNKFLCSVFTEFITNNLKHSVAFSASNFNEFERSLKMTDGDIDYVILDIDVYELGDYDWVSPIIHLLPMAKVIVISSYCTKELIVTSFVNGACSFSVKDQGLDEIFSAIGLVEKFDAYISPTAAKSLMLSFRGNINIDLNKLFTKREKELINFAIRGMSYKEIAMLMNITAFTVNHHLKKIYQKLNVRSKAELISKLSGLRFKSDTFVFDKNVH